MKKILLLLMIINSLSIYCQETTTVEEPVEWIVIKESALDSITLNYYKNKNIIAYSSPKNENVNVFMAVANYVSGLLDESLSSINKNANKFYDTPVGFWATWGIFYHYVGSEFLTYLWTFIYLIICTIFFVWLWRKKCIHKTVIIDPLVTEHGGEKKIIEENNTNNTNRIQYSLQKTNVVSQFWYMIVFIILFIIGTFIM